MGNLLSRNNDKLKQTQKNEESYVLKTAPVIWLIGDTGSLRDVQAKNLASVLDFVNIRVGELILNEIQKQANNKTKTLRRGFTQKISDSKIVNLIKQEILKDRDVHGYIINNFPKSLKQADIFEREIFDMDCLVHLSTNMTDVINNGQPMEQKEDKVIHYEDMKSMNKIFAKYASKLERIDCNKSVDDVYYEIEDAITKKLQMKRVAEETDYAQ